MDKQTLLVKGTPCRLQQLFKQRMRTAQIQAGRDLMEKMQLQILILHTLLGGLAPYTV